ncbi:MAG: nickel pincer cofactor biosynthesis protein LarB [Phycisphaeraceae bacterium]|nr:nickel pincer cofactor biosynthesis protein LarB [Phycisphaeraceae bacterium]
MDDTPSIETLLAQVAAGECSADDAAKHLHAMQAQPLGFATLDHHRADRCGSSEVIYAAGKTADQVVKISQALLEKHDSVLITRAEREQIAALESAYTTSSTPIEVGQLSGTVLLGQAPAAHDKAIAIPIVTAGTSDLPVAEECVMTCKAMGQPTEAINDVGVAGLHRIIGKADAIRAGQVVVVVAGMEGALPSVVGGLVDKPVIAVPTSVGYGAAFGGVAALLGMLNSCASGVTVVNIDNGFGAGLAASRINQLTQS